MGWHKAWLKYQQNNSAVCLGSWWQSVIVDLWVGACFLYLTKVLYIWGCLIQAFVESSVPKNGPGSVGSSSSWWLVRILNYQVPLQTYSMRNSEDKGHNLCSKKFSRLFGRRTITSNQLKNIGVESTPQYLHLWMLRTTYSSALGLNSCFWGEHFDQ